MRGRGAGEGCISQLNFSGAISASVFAKQRSSPGGVRQVFSNFYSIDIGIIFFVNVWVGFQSN